MLDLHASHASKRGAGMQTGCLRLAALAHLRDSAARAEQVLTHEKERVGRQEAALKSERALQRERGAIVG